jgi:uncharacterized protein
MPINLDDVPKSELLEVYPCVYPLSVIGWEADDFENCVVEIVARHFPDLDRTTVTSQPSSTGKYRSVRLSFLAQSHAQVESLYQELNAHERVVRVI